MPLRANHLPISKVEPCSTAARGAHSRKSWGTMIFRPFRAKSSARSCSYQSRVNMGRISSLTRVHSSSVPCCWGCRGLGRQSGRRRLYPSHIRPWGSRHSIQCPRSARGCLPLLISICIVFGKSLALPSGSPSWRTPAISDINVSRNSWSST